MTSERWQELKPLFFAAAELPATERAAYLDRACSDDADLRAEVDALLAAEDEIPRILDATPTRLARLLTGDEATTRALASKDRIDQTVGPYRILREIGRGGMGIVYLAERADVDKRVALKVVRRLLGGQQVTQRFLNERRILARLDHPNIARLLDAGRTDEGTPFFAMEYVRGTPLVRYCREQALGIDDRLRLFAQACEAVRYAHQNLVVHRDLKPSNILVTESPDAPPQAKLLDFGIAKLLENEADGAGLTWAGLTQAGLTRTGQLALTPAYAAPEQIRGGAVTTATDVYSLGMILFELLVGRRPYEVDDRTPAAVERRICDSQVPRPSTAAAQGPATTPDETPGSLPQPPAAVVRRRSRRLRGDLDTICLKALAKEPPQRYATAEALLDDIRRHLAGLPVVARPQTATYRLKKFTARHRWGVATALALLLTAAGLAGFHTRRVTAERDRVTAALAESEAVTGFLIELFEANEPDAAGGVDRPASELLARGLERADALADEPTIQARMLDAVGQVYVKLGQYDAARPVLERALALRRAHLQADNPLIGESARNLSWLLQVNGHYDEAATLLHEAFEHFSALFDPSHETVAFLANDLGSLSVRRGEHAAAEAFFRQALAGNRARLGPDAPDVATNLGNLGYALHQQEAYDEAEALYRQALTIHRRHYGEVHTQVALVMNNLSVLLQDREDYRAAEPILRQVLTIRRQLLGDSHPNIATALNNLGTLLSGLDRLEEAEAMHREALAMRRALLSDDHPLVALSQHNLGRVLTRRGRYAEASELLQAAIALRRKIFGDDHPRVASTTTHLGSLMIETGAYSEAEAHLQTALAIYQSHYDADHQHVRRVQAELKRLHDAWDRP
ncbi:MAG: serine/threonine-protein kinase [Acidobacteriota bacterium]